MARPQLTLAQRYKISSYLQVGISISQIAEWLGVHRSTIYREILRNSLNGKYHPETAEKLIKERRASARKHQRISDQTWKLVTKLIKIEFSPEQIAGSFECTGTKQISPEWIYQYILADQRKGGTLFKHLRRAHKTRRKRTGKQDRRGSIPGRISIDERPSIVDEKARVGDWEIDTAIGKNHQGALIIAVERKTKLTIIGHSPYKKADLVSKEIIQMLKPYRKHVLTITVDNGKEFTNHKQIAKALKADVYFAHPYSAWERGLNENTVGLVRQYFPKNMSLRFVDPGQIKTAQDRLNIRPRKTLGFRSPADIFFNPVAFGT